eukprot:g11970.t1
MRKENISDTENPTTAAQEDWQTIVALGVLGEVAAPHVIFDVTQKSNGCGGCTQKAMNSEEAGQSMWKTIDGSDWWLRDTPFGEPNGDYHANCFLGLWLPPQGNGEMKFNDYNCQYHSTKYLCQPDIRYTTTTTEEPEKSLADSFAPGLALMSMFMYLFLA